MRTANSLPWRWVLPAVAAALALSACSTGDEPLGAPVASESTDADVTAAPDVCALLSPAEVDRITGWTVPDGVDHSERIDSDEFEVCSYTEPDHVGLIQVQLDRDAGRPEFDRRRTEMEATGMDGRDVGVPGVDAAFDSPAHGVVGMLVDDTFVQVVTIGPGVDDTHHLQLAAVVAGNLS